MITTSTLDEYFEKLCQRILNDVRQIVKEENDEKIKTVMDAYMAKINHYTAFADSRLGMSCKFGVSMIALFHVVGIFHKSMLAK